MTAGAILQGMKRNVCKEWSEISRGKQKGVQSGERSAGHAEGVRVRENRIVT